MSRKQRIHLVVALSVGLLSMLFGLVVWPLLTALMWPMDWGANGENFNEVMATSFRLARISSVVSIYCLIVTCPSFLYAFFVWAAWFVGRGDSDRDRS